MLFDVGWLILVWVIWIVVTIVALWLVRVTMHGQQETANKQESEITAWQVSHGRAQEARPDTAPQTPLSAT